MCPATTRPPRRYRSVSSLHPVDVHVAGVAPLEVHVEVDVELAGDVEDPFDLVAVAVVTRRAAEDWRPV